MTFYYRDFSEKTYKLTFEFNVEYIFVGMIQVKTKFVEQHVVYTVLNIT